MILGVLDLILALHILAVTVACLYSDSIPAPIAYGVGYALGAWFAFSVAKKYVAKRS